ncbi:uncharacterized protein LOC115443342 [Manduca sexta]|uniref:uncharacterized protein LOC115443342 n=1 Tax=Manduca sexta TaxID=7130 RepID=UPI001890874B|nr:uncharacterized protein LOC115443342 [Manduca sexta]
MTMTHGSEGRQITRLKPPTLIHSLVITKINKETCSEHSTMNQIKRYAILTILSVLIVENHGGLLNNVFGTLHNTTHDVATGVGNILSFGKGIVLGNRETHGNEVVGEKKGIVTGIIDTVHQGVHDIHQGIRNVILGEDKNNTKGIIENVYDKVKNKFVKVKEFLGDGEKRKEMIHNSRDHVVDTYKNLNQLIFGNDTKKHGSKLTEVMNHFKDKINLVVHHTSTEKPQPDKGEDINTDGTGLIDIRMASDNLARNLDEDMAKTTKRFHQGLDELNNNAIRNRNYIEKIAKEAMDKEKELMEASKKKTEEGAIVFKD